MSGPHVVVTLPSGSIFTSYYMEIEALTDAQGNPTNVITPDEGTVTVSGITDAGPASGSTIQAFLFDYTVDSGLPEETDIAAQTAKVSATDLHETDSQGNELYSWSATLSTAGLAPGLYALQSFSYVPGYVETNGVPVPLSAYEDDQGTVTVSEAVPYTYVVRADTEIVSVGTAQSTVPIYLPNANSSVQLSSDGRYVVWTSGDEYEEDLQTGATIDLTTTGEAAPALQTTLAPTLTPVAHPDPYGPEYNAGYSARNYPTFTEGGVTFGTIPDFDFNANDGTENPLPTVTDANGDTEVLAPFGIGKVMTGYAAAASDNGNAVLTVEPYDVTYFTPYGSDSNEGTSASPEYYVVYRSPAPTLTLDPVNGDNEFSPGAGTVTLTGTSNAIGQSVEIDFGQAGAEVGTATVQADGSWSYSFDASTITGTSLFIEASVMSAAGTPASDSETAQINTLPAPTVTQIFGNESGEEGQTLGPGATITIYVNTSAAVFVTGTPSLTLSNGEAATYSGGSGSQQIAFTYVPAIIDAGSSDLAVTGLNLTAGADIADAAGVSLVGPFDQPLGEILQTVPVIEGLDPAGPDSAFITNSATPDILVSAQSGETITLYDNGTVVGTGSTPLVGPELEVNEIEITPTVPLPEGQSTLTASATDSTGRSSALSSPVTITVDTVPPTETITGLAANGNDDVTLAAQAGLAITVTGSLSAALQPGEGVAIVLPNGQTEFVTPATGATTFSFSPTAAQAATFGAGGSISAFVFNEAGNVGTSTTQSFTADALRLITLVSAEPTDPSQASGSSPALSADGTTVAFEAEPTGDFGDAVPAGGAQADPTEITSGIYVETLATGVVTLAQADGEDAALSGDGTILAYDVQGSSGFSVHAEDLTTGSVTLVSAAGGVAADQSSFDPSISADGTEIAFLSYADNLVAGVTPSNLNAQLYVATLSAGAVTGITAVSVAADGTAGNGLIEAAALSGDGSEVVFSSTDTNLLAAGDPHTPNLTTSTGQIYVRALADNAASGLTAGEVVLVTGNADGTVGNTTSNAAKLSANGRYVVFTSEATNLAPSNLASGATLPTGGGVEQVYVKDLLTGTVSLVSQTAAGVVGDGYAQDASISSDGTTVVFSDTADNLGAGAVGEQLYDATLSNGVVTRLTLLSEPGAIPGDGPSTGPALSADGATVVFQSAADNLVAGSGTDEQVYETSTAATVAPPVTDVFSETQAATSGPYSGSYLWSNDANWSQGVPTAGSAVLMAAVGVDDIAGLSLASLNLSPPASQTGMAGELLVEAGLTVGTLTIAPSTFLEVVGSGTPNTLTITGNISAPQTPSVLPTIDADGAGAVVDDQEATTPAVEYIAQDGGEVELAGAVSASTVLTYGGGTFALAAAGATIAATLADVGNGDVLELPGTSVSAVTFGTSSISVTTDQGSFDFTNVTYAPGGAAAAAVTHDSATGLEAITFVGADIFSDTDASTSGSYLWSNAANWSQGVPTAGASVIMAAVGVDDIAGLSLASLNLSPPANQTGMAGELLVEAGLTVGTLTIAPSTFLEVVGSGTPNTLTITGNISAPQTPSVLPTIDADGAGAVVDDQEATTPQIQYIAQDGGEAELAGAVSAGTVLTYGGGTFALAAPGATIAATLADVAVGDVLELPGHGVQSATFGTNSLTITTDEGTTDFTDVTFDGVVNGYTTLPDDATGLEAITFTGPDVFDETQAPASGFYRWSDAANWSQGVPTSGNSVAMAGVGEDDIVGLSLTSLSVSPPPGDAGVDGQLLLDDDLTVYSLTVAVSSEIDLIGGAEPTILTVNGPSTIDGAIFTDPSTIAFAGAVDGSGTIEIGADSDVTFDGPVAATVTVEFLSNTGTLTIGDPSLFDAQIVGSGTEIVICYLSGTRVLTPSGEVPIESLVRGDRLVTRFGGVQTIKWIGRQSFAARFIARKSAQWPVRIAAGALGSGRPARDLFVSAGHSMLIEDRLILARNLVNGITITQSRPTDDIHYYQVEFEGHDCILAEGAWSESYADDEVLRNQFHNVGEFRALFPDHRSPPEPVLCAPRPQSGPDLEDALRPILARAAVGLRPGPLRGWIDSVEPGRITGWAQDMAYPEMPVQLDLWLDDEPLGTILSCEFRGDLEAAGIGRGYCSFSFATPFPIPAASIRHLFICRAADGAALALTEDLQARCG